MIIDRGESLSTIKIERYADLLTLRTLPEWAWVDYRVAQVRDDHLVQAGLVEPETAATFEPVHGALFDYQAWIVELALARQRSAVFADTGLGKTLMQLEWARQVHAATGGRVLLLSPLQVVTQTAVDEVGKHYGDTLTVVDLRQRADLTAWLHDGTGIGITNHEKVDGADRPWPVTGVVVDESSVLKASMGVRRTSFMAAFKGVPWKLCCSATPAQNDRVEYAEHAYFLEVVRSTREFLAAFFTNRDGEWQLKRHGRQSFYRHLASWSVFLRSPLAYGFDTDTSLLPLTVDFPHVELSAEQHRRGRAWEKGAQPSLYGATPGGVTSRTKVAQIANGFELVDKRVEWFPSDKPLTVARIVNEVHADEQCLVWVDFDAEAEQLGRLIPDAVVLSGKTKQSVRDDVIASFRAGRAPRVLVVKPSMFAHGLNLQNCRVQVFSTLRDSFERYYQAVRRSYRYGQTEPVQVYVPLTGLDEAMVTNVLSKQAVWQDDAAEQEAAFVAVLRPRDSTERTVLVTEPAVELDRTEGDTWTMIHGDSVAHMPTMAENSMDLAVFSPPFANLFTYSSAAADMGNVRSDDEYRLQWEFFVEELFRVMKPGRVVAVHCMDVIRFAGQHGHRYTYDYPADLRLGMEAAGFHYHARIAIDKNPQIQATRTKDHNLLFVTLTRNALNSHPQASECVLMFRKPGDSDVPVIADDVSNQEWIEWAHHVWYGIRETDVLNAALAKEEEDERHIAPLQLSLIERCVRLWTNRGETVFSPFAGIGSEGWEALDWGRRFYGVELKRSYFDTACRFLAEKELTASGRFDFDTTGERPVAAVAAEAL